MINDKLSTTLEHLIDTQGISDILEALSSICEDKAERAEEDSDEAEKWEQYAIDIDELV